MRYLKPFYRHSSSSIVLFPFLSFCSERGRLKRDCNFTMRTGVLLYAKLNQTIMTGYKVRLFSSHRKDKTIEAKGEYFYYRYFICSRSLVELE